jgi:hypothetical protein
MPALACCHCKAAVLLILQRQLVHAVFNVTQSTIILQAMLAILGRYWLSATP